MSAPADSAVPVLVVDHHGRSHDDVIRNLPNGTRLYAAPQPPAEAQGGGESWHHPDALPPVEPGKQGWFWVAVRRVHNGRIYSFPATYLNAMVLTDENGDRGEFAGNHYHHSAVDEDEGTFLATGWHDAKEHSEYSGLYSPLLDSDKDELIAWRAVTDYGDTAPPSAPVGVDPRLDGKLRCIASLLQQLNAQTAARAVMEAVEAVAQQPAACGTCREIIRPDALTGTTCACDQQPAAVDGAICSLPALWRQREDNGEERTEFDKGYEQASDECADALEAALAAQPQGGAKP